MTTISYTGIDELSARLRAVQRRRWSIRCAAGLCALLVVAGGSVILTAGALGYWPDQPPVALRWGVLAAGAVAWTAAAWVFIRRAVLWRQTPAQTALFVEANTAGLRNNIINAVLLADDTDQPSKPLVQQTIDESLRSAKPLDFVRAVPTGKLKRWAIAAGAVVLAALLLAALQGGHLRRGLQAAMSPTAYIPRANSIVLRSLTPGDVTVFTGQSVAVIVRIDNPRGLPHEASIFLPLTGRSVGMVPSDENTTYTAALSSIAQTMDYQVRIGASRWPADKPAFTITAVERLGVESLAVRYDYPPYTQWDSRTIDDFDGHIQAPAGSQAHLTLTLNQPAPAVLIDLGSHRTPMSRSGDGRVFSTVLPIDADGRYRLLITDDAGRTLQRLPDGPGGSPTSYDAAESWYRLLASPDAPPTIAFLSPGRDVSAPLDGSLATHVQVSDDYALSAAGIYAAKRGEPFKLVGNYPVVDRPGGRFAHELTFDALGPLADGDVVDYYAQATDNRDTPAAGPQTTRTEQYHVTVRDPAARAAEIAAMQEQLRKRLLALLAAQTTRRVDTAICLAEHDTLDQIAATAGGILLGQQTIHAEIADLVSSFPFDAETIIAERTLADLAGADAPLAVEQARVLAELTSFGLRVRPCQALGQTQDAIISRLEMLLAVMAGSARPEASTSLPGDDPADDRQQAIDELRAKLTELADGQEQLVLATSELAKKPMDDFTSADEQMLADLKAQADDLAKFIDEIFSDLSKLPQQNFANPLLLAELLAIRTDIAMAADALGKEAIEVAVAIEQAGLENAENLTTNLEKWLPDEPDREKYVMEDPLTAENIEQAELPAVLEDLIGDLLEDEEDLLAEADDVTSAWADSLDKGAGLELAEGPISSMNAQGVTGNVLPNTSEIAGRSGEGRTGKSSGEFVQEDAVGKGGRQTPTRLTAEPYQAGQVDDASVESPGGATGGGKLSGAGAAGLEGPLPPAQAKQMDRLAGQQAAIINRAERLRAKLDPADYASYRLLEAISLMNRIHSDLANYRYSNVLRVRQSTLGALQDARDELTGQVEVVGDTSTGLPKYIRDNINAAMADDLPAEYRDHLEQYYRRISDEAGR